MVLIKNPLKTDLVLSGFRSLAPGEVVDVPDHIVAMYGKSVEVVQPVSHERARTLNLTSFYDMATGYGLGSANLAMGLADRGLPLNLSGATRPYGHPPLDGVLQRRLNPLPRVGLVRWIPECFKECVSPYRIGWTMWDTPRLPSWWVPLIHDVQHLIVPSEEQERIFRASGVRTPISCVPEPIRLDEYPYVDRQDREVFTFVSVARMCSRKCPIETVHCFQRAFPDNRDVRLIMKTINGQFGMGRAGIPRIDDPRVSVVDQHWSQDQVVGLFHHADAAVFLSHGEGFGHGCVQAMATGLPTIVPSHSGCSAYANPAYNYPVRTAGTEPTDYYVSHMGSHERFEWWVMDYDDVIEQMRAVYANRREAKAKGKRAAAWVRKTFGFDKTIDKVLRVLEPHF